MWKEFTHIFQVFSPQNFYFKKEKKIADLSLLVKQSKPNHFVRVCVCIALRACVCLILIIEMIDANWFRKIF